MTSATLGDARKPATNLALAARLHGNEKGAGHEPQPKGRHRDEHTPGRVGAGMGGCAPATAREGEGIDPRPRRAGRLAAADAAARGGEGVRVRRTGRKSESGRRVPGAPPADRLSCVLRARRQRLARACLHRLLLRGRSGCPPRPSERPRHDSRVRLARAAGGH